MAKLEKEIAEQKRKLEEEKYILILNQNLEKNVKKNY